MYEAPQVRELGTVEELTQVNPSNKRGSKPDIYSSVVPVVGSLGPVQ